jgi:outer membrane biogenesis lipoprotein LolB
MDRFIITETKKKTIFTLDEKPYHKKSIKVMRQVGDLIESELKTKLPLGATGALRASLRQQEISSNGIVGVEVYSTHPYAQTVESGQKIGNRVPFKNLGRWVAAKNKQGKLKPIKSKKRTNKPIPYNSNHEKVVKKIHFGIYHRGTNGKKTFQRLMTKNLQKRIYNVVEQGGLSHA